MLTRPNAYCLLAALSAAAVLAVASAASAQSSVSLDWEVIGYPTGDDQVTMRGGASHGVGHIAPADAWNVSHGDCTLVWYRRGGWLLLANAARPRLASLMQSACPQHKIVTSPAVKINGYNVPLKFETLYRSGDTYGTLRRHVCPRV